MFSSDSDSDFDEDLQFLLGMKLLKSKKMKRRYWVHPINRGRQDKGEFHRLVKELESDQEKFHQYFRMNKAQYEEVHSLIEGDIKKVHTKFREPIGTKERLALCLRFLATGHTFRSLAFNYRMGFSTVRVIVQEVCEAIWKNMAPIVMPTPSEQMWKDIANNFKQFWHFPNCIGALDGKHVNIICPINAGSTFYNYKQEHSIVLLALVDAQYKFIMIDVGAYGRNSDGGIYDKSLMGRLFEQKALNVPHDEPLSVNSQPMPYTIVADAAFPLKPYLLKPFHKDKLVNNDANKIFNYRLSRARRCVENAFGILRARFRVFHGPMQVQPDMVDKIVLAACCLHNFLRTQTLLSADNAEENLMDSTDHSSNIDCLLNIESLPRNPSQNAVYVREKYKEYFISQEGRVPWQIEMIRRGRHNFKK